MGPVGPPLYYLLECPYLPADPLEVHSADLFLEAVGSDLLMEGRHLQSQSHCLQFQGLHLYVCTSRLLFLDRGEHSMFLLLLPNQILEWLLLFLGQ